jgi:hypothetical protein
VIFLEIFRLFALRINHRRRQAFREQASYPLHQSATYQIDHRLSVSHTRAAGNQRQQQEKHKIRTNFTCK